MTTTRIAKIPKRQNQIRLHFSLNWPLLIGTLLVAFVIALAIFGPDIAPNDPLQENLLVQDDVGQWYIPPFPAFTVSGFPLGSDEFGRDLYSRLLWAVRPTLQMVAVVATVRLVLGTLIGLIAGWSSGRAGRFFDTLIGGALALPGLLVALGAIAVVGVELGIIAFIIGLSVTGWAETARIVREQTRSIRGQLFVEAARAMGSSDTQIVFRHVLRQIASMIWMLLAFEIGSTLMLTAGLGFLGYYIGGDVWVDVADFVARRTSGAPELGQMLATAWVRLTDPWGLVSVGSVVFVAVLGFNLVGEGLRLRISPEAQISRIKWLRERTANLRLWLDDRFWYPVGQFLFGQRLAFGLLMFIAGAALGASGVWGWKQGIIKLDSAQVSFLYGDSSMTQTPQPTQGSATETPAVQDNIDAGALIVPSEPVVMGQVDVKSAFIGAPVIGSDKTVYTTSADNQLRAFDPEGGLLWQIELKERPVGTPAIAPDGTIYVTDKAGALNAVSPTGEIVWRFEIDPPRSATSGPTLGADDTIYYALGAQAGLMQAVSQKGEGLWLGQGKTFSYFKTPVVHLESGLVFLWDDIFNTSDGVLQEFEFPTEVDRFLVGEDGNLYMRTGHTVVEWRVLGGSPEILRSISWNYTAFINEGILPQQTGVTKNQVSWELYTTEFGGSTTIFWVEMVDGEGQLVGSASAPVSQGNVIFMDDQTLTAVVCGLGDFEFQRQNSPKPECHAIRPEEDESLWMIQIEENGVIVGAAYREGMLYITTQEGKLFVVNESPMSVETTFVLPTEKINITDPVIAWQLEDPNGFSGNPAVGLDGTIYAATNGGTVYALAGDGRVLWQVEVTPPPAFSPTLHPNGALYISDVEGGLTALNEEGETLWQFKQPIAGLKAVSQVLIAFDGTLYYSVTDDNRGYVQAVSSQGEGKWLSEATTLRYYEPPRLSVTGELVFLGEDIFEADTGDLLNLEVPVPVSEFVSGFNGKDYLLAENTLFEWRFAGNRIELVATIEVADRPAVVFGNVPTPIAAQVAPDGTVIFVYRDRILWQSESGELEHVVDVPNGSLVSHVVALEEEQNLLTCGIFRLSTQDSIEEQCMGFSPGVDRNTWQVTLGKAPGLGDTVAGEARTPTGFVFASETGVLYGVMERAIAEKLADVQTSGTSGVATLTRSGWSLDFPEPISAGPFTLDDGGGYLLSESNQVYIFTADGDIRKVITLPTLPHQFEFQGFGGGRTVTPVPPFITTNDLLIVVSSDKVYALNPDESLRWEALLQDLPFSFPAGGPIEGVFYQIDTLGTLYAFSVLEGLVWKHDPDEGLKGASPAPVFGPQGNIYYTITNGTKGMVEALSPEGDFLWRAELKTFNFFRPIQISPDGNWLAVDDDVIYTQTGALQDIESQVEFQIDQFIMGGDRNTYLRSGNTIIQWEIDNGQFKNLHQFTFSTAGIRTFADPTVTVSPEGIFWFRLATSRVVNLWVDQEGQVVGFIQWPRRDERLLEEDPVQMTLSVCDPILEENRVDCRGYALGSTEPVWELSIQGIGRADQLIYENGTLFVQVDRDTIQAVKVNMP